MSVNIPVAFAQKFRDDIIMLSQQRTSRLEGTVRDDPDQMDAKFGHFERIGATAMQESLGRHADTPLISTDHTRRRVGLRDFDWADLIDKKDMRRMIIAGQLPAKYRINAIQAANRKKDELIIAAATGNAFSIDEDDAATTVALPTSQIVAVNATNLTLVKVLEAKRILDAAEVDEELKRWAVVSAFQLEKWLNITEVKSADFNSVKALVQGDIDTYLGFKWIRSELLTKVGADRHCLFYAEGAMGLAKGQEIEADIGPRRDKRNSIQVYVDMSFDATRIEDEKMVRVDCLDT